MAAGSATTKTVTGYLPTLDGQPQNHFLAATPGTNATWTNFTGNEAAIQTACVDAGKFPILADGVEYWIPVFKTT